MVNTEVSLAGGPELLGPLGQCQDPPEARCKLSVALLDGVAVDPQGDRRIGVAEPRSDCHSVESAAIACVALKCRKAWRWVSTPALVATRVVNFDTTPGRTGSVPAGEREKMNASGATVTPRSLACWSTDAQWRSRIASPSSSSPMRLVACVLVGFSFHPPPTTS